MAFSTWRPKRRKKKTEGGNLEVWRGFKKKRDRVFLIIENYFSFLSSIFSPIQSYFFNKKLENVLIFIFLII
jgi:hypothetical protein